MRKTLLTLALFSAFAGSAFAAAAPSVSNDTLDTTWTPLAKHGADDPVGHKRKGGEGVGHMAADGFDIAKHGADDPVGHKRKGGEGVGHKAVEGFDIAKNGADDPKGHKRGEGPGHA